MVRLFAVDRVTQFTEAGKPDGETLPWCLPLVWTEKFNLFRLGNRMAQHAHGVCLWSRHNNSDYLGWDTGWRNTTMVIVFDVNTVIQFIWAGKSDGATLP
jgi:hypothetical protein